MPTYGYRCPAGHEFEIWQSMQDEATADCPECGQPARRLFFPAGIVFKGTGFYKTDSRSGSTVPSPSGKAPAKTGSNQDGSGNAKPASTDTSSARGPAADHAKKDSPGDSSTTKK